MSRSRLNLYLISVIFTMLILPVISLVLERMSHPMSICYLIGKWFVFWAIGIRLFLAGLRQASKPSFTAKEIFHIQGTESFAVIRELGFGNLAIAPGVLFHYCIPNGQVSWPSWAVSTSAWPVFFTC